MGHPLCSIKHSTAQFHHAVQKFHKHSTANNANGYKQAIREQEATDHLAGKRNQKW